MPYLVASRLQCFSVDVIASVPQCSAASFYDRALPGVAFFQIGLVGLGNCPAAGCNRPERNVGRDNARRSSPPGPWPVYRALATGDIRRARLGPAMPAQICDPHLQAGRCLLTSLKSRVLLHVSCSVAALSLNLSSESNRLRAVSMAYIYTYRSTYSVIRICHSLTVCFFSALCVTLLPDSVSLSDYIALYVSTLCINLPALLRHVYPDKSSVPPLGTRLAAVASSRFHNAQPMGISSHCCCSRRSESLN
jgi:hypothetical protein